MESKDSGSMAEYYSKISEIRARILSKHGIASPEMAPVTSNQPRYSLPQQENSDGSFVETRVRELECVNDRIKSILAAKRSPSISNPTSDKYLSKGPIELPIKRKLFSLFQDENNILESKVTNTKVQKQGGYCQSRLIRDVSYEREKFQSRGQFDGKEVEFNYKLNEMSLQDYRNKYQSNNSQSYKDMQFKPTITQPQQKYKFVQQQSKPRELQLQVRSRQRQDIQIQKEQPFSSSNGENQRLKLVKLLAKQAELEGLLRQEKQLFAQDKSSGKWNKLSKELSLFGSNLPQSQIEIWASISPEEFNPFADLSKKTVDLKILAQALISAKDHWQRILKDCVSIKKLEEEGFSMSELDLGGKGYLCIEDLVCFINLNSDSCLRNRDLCSLFRRWRQLSSSSDSGLPFIAFLNHVAK